MESRKLVVLLLISCSSAFAVPPMSKIYEGASSLFSAQPRTKETDAYADAWAAFNNSHHLDERDGCYFKATGPLVQILQINAEGTVVGYYSDKINGRSECWRKTYMGVTFPKPPFAPFYHRLEMR